MKEYIQKLRDLDVARLQIDKEVSQKCGTLEHYIANVARQLDAANYFG